jgi:hypothetical protein
MKIILILSLVFFTLQNIPVYSSNQFQPIQNIQSLQGFNINSQSGQNNAGQTNSNFQNSNTNQQTVTNNNMLNNYGNGILTF